MKHLLVLACTAALFFGCDKEDDEDKEANFAAKDIAGTWAVACVPAALGQLTAYRVATLTLTAEGDYSYTHTSYQDAACTIKFYDETSTGKFSLGDAVDAYGRRVTLEPVAGIGTPRAEPVITAFNTLNVCGHTDWAIDGAVDLMNTGCIGWSESNATQGVNLAEVGGVLQLQVFSLSGEDKQRNAGDDFNKQ